MEWLIAQCPVHVDSRSTRLDTNQDINQHAQLTKYYLNHRDDVDSHGNRQDNNQDNLKPLSLQLPLPLLVLLVSHDNVDNEEDEDDDEEEDEGEDEDDDEDHNAKPTTRA